MNHPNEPQRSFKFRFSPEVSVADIIAILVIGVPVLIWGAKMDTRVTTLETQAAASAAATVISEARTTAAGTALRLEIREDLRDINRKLDALAMVPHK